MHHLTARFDPAAQVTTKDNPAMSQIIICPGRGLFLPMNERRFSMFKNIYCTDIYVAKTAERYAD